MRNREVSPGFSRSMPAQPTSSSRTEQRGTASRQMPTSSHRSARADQEYYDQSTQDDSILHHYATELKGYGYSQPKSGTKPKPTDITPKSRSKFTSKPTPKPDLQLDQPKTWIDRMPMRRRRQQQNRRLEVFQPIETFERVAM